VPSFSARRNSRSDLQRKEEEIKRKNRRVRIAASEKQISITEE